MHILCPHCHNPIEVVKLTPREEIACPSCGSSFRLETDSTTCLDRAAGQKLGRFEVIESVGQGAFGTVYKARDPELDRTVAIKVPRAGNLADPQELDRFLREARSVAQLRHPSIVTIHEVGQSEGVPYLVSDFVQGVTLADLMTARRPGFRQAAELVALVADALHFAHERGVVHRDVKPSNIMIDDGKPVVMDFGLAKRDASEITMTIEGQVLGTPAYMSPEQARGDAHTVDGRSDVYSLGVVLYQLLTGELPFRGIQRMLLHQVLHDEPRPPRRLNDRIPRDLETICLKAMAKEPPRRYGTARELADDLRRWLGGESIRARPVSAWERAWTWARRRPAAAAFLLVSSVAALASVGLVVGLLYNQQLQAALDDARQAHDLADQARTAEEEQRKKAETYLYFSRVALAEREWLANNGGQAEQLLEECRPELRGWEWHYLRRLSRGSLLTLRSADQMKALAFSLDGQLLASGGNDRTIKVWNALTGREVLTIPTRESVPGVAWSPDGRLIAAGQWSADQRKSLDVTLWEAASGREQLRLPGHSSSIFSVAFSPDGSRLASASADQTVRIWDLASGREVHTLRAASEPFNSVAFSPDRRRVAAGVGNLDDFAPQAQTGKVLVWDADTGQSVHTLAGHANVVTGVAFSPDGSQLVSSSWDQSIRVWEAATGQEVRTLRGHTARVNDVRGSRDGRLLASGSHDGSLKVWDAATGSLLRTLRGHTGPVSGVAFSPVGPRLASAGDDGTVRVWDPTTDADSRTLRVSTTLATCVSFSPDGKQLAVTSVDGTVKTLDALTGQDLQTLRGHSRRIWRLVFSPDGRLLASASEDKTARVWDASSGKQLLSLEGHALWVQSAVFSPDGLRLATASGDQTVKVWDAATGRELLTLAGHIGRVWSVAFSQDGGRITSGAGDKTARVWDAATGQQLLTLAGHDSEVTCVLFSPDGRRTASGSYDRTVRVWDATAGKDLLALRGHANAVYGLAFSPDGQRLASASKDGTVNVWDASTGQEYLTLRADAGGFHSVAFSPDGQRIAASGYDGTVRIWDARP